MRVTCLGDSICFGYGVASGAGWVALLSGDLAGTFPECTFHNAGISGETAWEGLSRLGCVLDTGRPDLLYVQFGLNDAGMGIAVSDYLGTVREIVARSLSAGVRQVLVANNHPVCVGEEGDASGVDAYRRMVGVLNDALRREYGTASGPVCFADVERLCASSGGVADQAALLQYDGVHLSEEGNLAYARFLSPVFRERLCALRNDLDHGSCA